MPPDMLGVLSSTRMVVEKAQHVRISQEAVQRVAKEVAARGPLERPPWRVEPHWWDDTERTANYVLVLDALNFSFWGEPRWRVPYHRHVFDGYWALAASLRRAIEEGTPVWDAAFLQDITREDLAHLLRGEGEVPMLDERVANLREAGTVLRQRYGGSFARAIEEAGRSCVRLVWDVVGSFSSFNDVATYDGTEVRFFKRAQILVADLYGAFDGTGWGEFGDLDQLTAFADYKVPQVLRHLGVLEYDYDLASKVDNRVPIPARSQEEIEIRAATVWAVESLRQDLARLGHRVRAFELDWYLWELGQHVPMSRPYHRTRTIFY